MCEAVTEIFNYTTLAEKLDAGDLADPDYAKSVLQSSTRGGGDMGQLIVHYYRKHDIPGRRLAQRPAFQWMRRSDRAIAFSTQPSNSFQGGMVFINVDVDNCFVVLLIILLEKDCDVSEQFPTLVSFKVNYKKWRSALAKYLPKPTLSCPQ